jgi:GNAT superfamily N-acetyltransferase
MMQLLDIIPCAADDADIVSRVAIKSYRDFYLYLWNDDGSWYINRSFTPAKIREEIADSNSAYFLLNANAEPIGFIKLNIDRALSGFEAFSALELERIYIVKAASAKGFGRQALSFCLNFAKEKNKELIWLKSMDSSPSVEFYKRFGFVECGSHELDFELMKPEYRGMKVFMKWLL